MARAKGPAIVLSERFVDVLKTQRELGPAHYPLSLRQLVALVEVQAGSEIVTKAVKSKPFKDEAVVAIKGNTSSLVALKDDAAQLASSPVLLEQLLELTCTPVVPTVALAALQKHLDTCLKKPFKDATERRIQEKSLPAKLDAAGTSKKPLLFLKSMPPQVPEVEFAKNLVRVLEAQRDRGSEAYPIMLSQLIALTDTVATLAIIRKALDQDFITERVVVSAPQAKSLKDCPVALKHDRDLLAGSAILLESLLRPLLKENSRTAALETLAGKANTELAPLVELALNRHVEANTLPPSLGWMWISKKRHLFFVEDVHTTGRSATPVSAVIAPTFVGFVSTFEDAFQQLNRAHGNHNFVSLVELRRAVPMDRAAFDAGLRELRQRRLYTVSAAEGRHGLGHEEQQAGILEDGVLLLYVSRRSS